MDIHQILYGLHCYVVSWVIQVPTIRISEQTCDADCGAVDCTIGLFHSIPIPPPSHNRAWAYWEACWSCWDLPVSSRVCDQLQQALNKPFLSVMCVLWGVHPAAFPSLFWGVSYIWLSCLQDLHYPCNLCPSIRLAEIDQWVQELLEKDTPTSASKYRYTPIWKYTWTGTLWSNTPIFLEARWKPYRRSLPTLAIVRRVSLKIQETCSESVSELN